MDAEEDSDMEEPIAHEKTSKKSVARDADSTDATDSLDNEGKSQNSHIQKSSKTIDDSKSAAKAPKEKKDVKK